MKTWVNSANFYHIYPLGFCGCEQFEIDGEPQHRILKIVDWIEHLVDMNINAVYLGPVFESVEHGYDTVDYMQVDKRLGTNEDLKFVCQQLHKYGIKVVLDGVFNHVGRGFWAFKDVLHNGHSSRYCSWFANLNFGGSSPMGDPFWYEGWQGHYNLVKLNLRNPEVCDHLMSAVHQWIDEYGIDGIRLDAADCIDPDFFRRLKNETKSRRNDFWLMAEIIHGDYNRWANESMLDSVTNYECYKGIYSSHNDKNYFEIAHSLNRQFGSGGIYKSIFTYNFVDNHDVNRVASVLSNKAHLKNVYTVVYTMPGAPSVYYGSEFGAEGVKANNSDAPLRPCLELSELQGKNCDLVEHISKLGKIHKFIKAFHSTNFENIIIRNQQLVYKRYDEGSVAFILLNLEDNPFNVTVNTGSNDMTDLLSSAKVLGNDGHINVDIPPHSSMVLVDTNSIPEDFYINRVPEVIKVLPDGTVDVPKELTTKEKIPFGRYKHFKGGEYEVIDIAVHSETEEEMVVYKALYGDNQMFVRPAKMWLDPPDRFTLIEKY